MRKNTGRVLAVALTIACAITTAGFNSQAATAIAPSDTKLAESIKDQESELPLTKTWEHIPSAAAVAVETQEWYQKALANTDGEADVFAEAAEGSTVAGKVYSNTMVSVAEKGDIWSRISSGSLAGYVKNDTLLFGKDAVERAKAVCPEGAVKNARTTEELAAEKAAKEAAEEAARQEAEAKEEAKKAKEARAVSADDQRLMAAIIFCEAGNQSYEGQVAVGAVIMNRVRSGTFANTISGVIYEAGQFGPAITGKLDRVLANGSYTDTSMAAAADAMAGANPIGSALYFGNGDYGQLIGDHYFH